MTEISAANILEISVKFPKIRKIWVQKFLRYHRNFYMGMSRIEMRILLTFIIFPSEAYIRPNKSYMAKNDRNFWYLAEISVICQNFLPQYIQNKILHLFHIHQFSVGSNFGGVWGGGSRKKNSI